METNENSYAEPIDQPGLSASKETGNLMHFSIKWLTKFYNQGHFNSPCAVNLSSLDIYVAITAGV